MPKKPKRKCFKHFKNHSRALKTALKNAPVRPVPVLNVVAPKEISDSPNKDVDVTVNMNSGSKNATVDAFRNLMTALPNNDTPPTFDISSVAVEDYVGLTAAHTSDAVESDSVSSMVNAIQVDVDSNICSTDSVVGKVTDTPTNVCYSTGEGLILDDILSIAQLVDPGLGGVDNRYELVLVGVPGSTKPLVEVQSVMSKWKDTEELLKPLLPLHIKTHVENDCFSILSLSRSIIKVVQRMLLFKPDGILEVYVHGKLIKDHHPIYTKVGSLPSIQEMSAKEASNKILSVVKIMRDFQTCMGASDKKCEMLWATFPGAFIEDGFEEYRYQKTLRPYDCDYLVAQRIQRCVNCSNLQKNLSRKLKRAAVIDEDAIPPKKSKSCKKGAHVDEVVTLPNKPSSCTMAALIGEVIPPKKKPNFCTNSSGKKKKIKKRHENNCNQKLNNAEREVGQEDDVDACPLGISLFDTLV